MDSVIIRTFYFLLCLVLIKGYVRVAGGYEAPEYFSQFHASLQNLTGYHICGGAVISAHHVITAAHCVYGADPENIKVVVGTTNLDNGGHEHTVLGINIHQHFEYQLKTNDIAILKIFGFFDIRIVNFLEINSAYLNEADPVILSGFGSQEPREDTGPQMYALDMTVFNQETCKYAMRNTRVITDEMFCTFTKIGEGTCHGDSGGPLIKDNKLVGVVSWGIPCAVGFPDVHTRIAPYAKWIQENIKIKRPEVCKEVCKRVETLSAGNVKSQT